VNAAFISTVDVVDFTEAIDLPSQRKTFYAKELFWVFYSDGANLVYKTSADGIDWSSKVTVAPCKTGEQFSVWYNGSHVAYTRKYGTSIYYRLGIPQSNGTIVWCAPEQTVTTQLDSSYTKYVNNWNPVTSEWGTYGDEPYLDSVGGGYIYTSSSYKVMKEFEFEDLPAGDWSITTFRIYVYGKISLPGFPGASGSFGVRLYVWKESESTWIYAGLVSFSSTSYTWKYKTVTEITKASDVNNAKLYLKSDTKTGDASAVYIDCAKIYVKTASLMIPSVILDSSGYPYITYSVDEPPYRTPYVVKSSLNNGSWNTATGYPLKISSLNSYYESSTIIPLLNEKVYVVVYHPGSTTIKGRLYNGTGWEEFTTINSSALTYSVVNIDDEIHIAFLDTSYKIAHKFYDGTDWNYKLVSSTNCSSDSYPVLSKHSTTLYCFWVYDNSYILYKKYDGNWDSDTSTLSQSTAIQNSKITCFYNSGNDDIGIVFLEGSAPPYHIRFTKLTLTIANWHFVETWNLTLKTLQWFLVESWNLILKTLGWYSVEIWDLLFSPISIWGYSFPKPLLYVGVVILILLLIEGSKERKRNEII